MIEVAVAMIGAIAVVIAATVPVTLGLRKARNENRDQHAENKDAFGELSGKVGVMHEEVRDMRKDFTRHLENHDKD
jgi:hypothetical protein